MKCFCYVKLQTVEMLKDVAFVLFCFVLSYPSCSLQGADVHVIIDAIASVMMLEEKELCITGELAIAVMNETASVIMGDLYKVFYVLYTVVFRRFPFYCMVFLTQVLSHSTSLSGLVRAQTMDGLVSVKQKPYLVSRKWCIFTVENL